MRILVSALVLAVCAFAPLPALADSPEESCPAAPNVSVSGLTGAPEPIQLVPPLNTYCWDLDGTYCSPVGSTRGCTDGIYYDYVCTCRYNSYYRRNYWDCPEVR